MATKRNSRKSGSRGISVLGKPNGVIQPRVEKVGPERFGIVAVDCAKARSKWMLCDFYGKVLVPPTTVIHGALELQLATRQVRDACERYGLRDHIVALEMTGTYHRPMQRAFRKAGSETRLVHPFATQHYRLPASADTKTDDKDLEAIFRAAVNGFGLLERPADEQYQRLQLIARHRRDLVEKRSRLKCQIRQGLERCLPGYAALFPEDGLWKRSAAMFVARRVTTPAEILEAGVKGITKWLRDEKQRFQSPTVERIIAWAGNAAEPDPQAASLARIYGELHDDWLQKTKQITQLELEIAQLLVKTPYILLLSHPGVSVVSAGELAGEMGPIEHYAHARAITGRAGLFPSRYQSDEVDQANGPLARHRNARLRAAWLLVADNLIKCNAHFRGKFQLWKQRGVDARDIRCRIANRAVRTVFQMVSGRQLYHHRSRLDRQYVLDKLLTFHQDHGTPPHQILCDMTHAAEQIPPHERLAEAAPLKQRYEQYRRSRSQGPRQIGKALLAVLARYGITGLESQDEAQGPIAVASVTST